MPKREQNNERLIREVAKMRGTSVEQTRQDYKNAEEFFAKYPELLNSPLLRRFEEVAKLKIAVTPGELKKLKL